jgi:glycosyltransferase involved in cell wall biosynthesis
MAAVKPPAEQRPMKPAFVVGGLYSLSNGVAWIMRDLAAALGRAGSPVTVCAADCWGRGAASVGHIFEPPTKWISARGLWLGGLSWSPPLKWKIEQVIREADIVHNHSLWMLPNSYGSRLAARHDKPVVITAHGALEPWAVQNSGWKKRVVGRWFQNQDLQRADCIHVNSRAEVEGIRQRGLRCSIAVIPNGIHPPDYEDLPAAESFRAQFPQTRDRKIALFMARLDKKKGLGHLIPAWQRVVTRHSNWHLVLAGPDTGYESTARMLVGNLHLQGSVTFTGPLHGNAKRAALAAADIFVQPSFSEGFSMSILEAMACRLPVLITPSSNFAEVVSAKAGLCVEPYVDGTADGLESLLALSAEERTSMGERARSLIESRYTWGHVAETTLSLYRWLIDGGTPPECVVD